MISYTLKSKLNDEKYNPLINTLHFTNKLYQIHFKFILDLKYNTSLPWTFSYKHSFSYTGRTFSYKARTYLGRPV